VAERLLHDGRARDSNGIALDRAQGTAIGFINPDNAKVLAGSTHWNEQVLSASIAVDGVPRALIEGSTYNGGVIQLQRRTVIHDSVALTSTMTIMQGREYVMNQRLTFFQADPADWLDGAACCRLGPDHAGGAGAMRQRCETARGVAGGGPNMS